MQRAMGNYALKEAKGLTELSVVMNMTEEQKKIFSINFSESIG
jgi:hypothetical protein